MIHPMIIPVMIVEIKVRTPLTGRASVGAFVKGFGYLL
jgi:hypothetical protein